MSAPVYLVCDSCGWFSGDLRLYDDAAVKCGECGAEWLRAFGALNAALQHQTCVRAAQHASDCAVHNEPALPRGRCGCDV